MSVLEVTLLTACAVLSTAVVGLAVRLRTELKWWTNRRHSDFSMFAEHHRRRDQELRKAQSLARYHRKKGRALRIKLREARKRNDLAHRVLVEAAQVGMRVPQEEAMTPAYKLKELREALEGATPGPWLDAGHKLGADGSGIAEIDFDNPKDPPAIVALMNAAPALLAIAEAAAAYRDFVANGRDNGVGELEARNELLRALDRLGGE